MKLTTASARMLSIAVFAVASVANAQSAGDTPLQMQSDKKLGFVTLNSDLVLHDGRLMLTVGAFNKGTQPVTLSPAAIAITTASGKPVPLASLAQLEDETRVALGGKPVAPGSHPPISTQRTHDTTAAGDGDVSGTGGTESLGAPAVTPKPRKKPDPNAETRIKEALDSLRMAILQGVAIEPRAAGGGQVVTQALKFARGEPRKLRMSVEFAGEHHEFEFEVPK